MNRTLILLLFVLGFSSFLPAMIRGSGGGAQAPVGMLRTHDPYQEGLLAPVPEWRPFPEGLESSPGRVAPPGEYYQIFIGQLPNHWTETQIEWMFLHFGITVFVRTMHNQHVFILVQDINQVRFILNENLLLLSERTGFWIMPPGSPRQRRQQRAVDLPDWPVVIESPRHRVQEMISIFENPALTREQFVEILRTRPDLAEQEARRRFGDFPPLDGNWAGLLETAILSGQIELDEALRRLLRL